MVVLWSGRMQQEAFQSERRLVGEGKNSHCKFGNCKCLGFVGVQDED